MAKELTAEQARPAILPGIFQCDTTEELRPTDGIIGQDRALSALKFGLNISKQGFNIYVSGMAGTGRTRAIKSFLDDLASQKKAFSDWCYVYNFQDSYYPKAMQLPGGMGCELQKDMKRAVESARRGLTQAFTSREYVDRRSEITEKLGKKREAALEELDSKARARGLVLQATPIGLMLVPMGQEGQPMTDEQYQKLSPQQRDELKKTRDELTKELKDQIASLRSEEGNVEKQLEEIDRDVARYTTSYIFEQLQQKYSQLAQVSDYLKAVQTDIVENFAQFKEEPRQAVPDQLAAMQEFVRQQPLRKYEVNVVVDNSGLKGAPVILEFNPTFNNLFGRIEKEAQFGALYTDFTMIKAGSLHRANGGYLVVRIEDILTNFQSWEGLKRALREGKIVIEEIGERLGYLATKSLRPEPIPLDLKVVIIGEPYIYYLLWSADPEFRELFKVKADFDTRMDRNEVNIKEYAGVICRLINEEKMRHLRDGALSKVMEYSSRLADDNSKLSTLFASISDIIREANFWAGEDGASVIESKHVLKSIEQKVYRSNLIQERINEMINDGTIMIDTEKQVVGQVNGLAVIDMGEFAFGRPSRITASVGLGREGLIDIEREAKLGGPIHTKGVLILSGYLTDKYVQDIPLSLSARIVFEQSYEGIEGDSASSTELYTLLSRLAEVPVRQGIAVTGSVNQKGEVQAIGGLNHKIEGYFEVCRLKGLNGKQGVLVPASNVKSLMLKEEVVAAIEQGKFHIYPVTTIDEGIEVLTGVRAGKRLPGGTFEPDTINGKVEKHLHMMAEKLRQYGRSTEEKSRSENKEKEALAVKEPAPEPPSGEE